MSKPDRCQRIRAADMRPECTAAPRMQCQPREVGGQFRTRAFRTPARNCNRRSTASTRAEARGHAIKTWHSSKAHTCPASSDSSASTTCRMRPPLSYQRWRVKRHQLISIKKPTHSPRCALQRRDHPPMRERRGMIEPQTALGNVLARHDDRRPQRRQALGSDGRQKNQPRQRKALILAALGRFGRPDKNRPAGSRPPGERGHRRWRCLAHPGPAEVPCRRPQKAASPCSYSPVAGRSRGRRADRCAKDWPRRGPQTDRTARPRRMHRCIEPANETVSSKRPGSQIEIGRLPIVPVVRAGGAIPPAHPEFRYPNPEFPLLLLRRHPQRRRRAAARCH